MNAKNLSLILLVLTSGCTVNIINNDLEINATPNNNSQPILNNTIINESLNEDIAQNYSINQSIAQNITANENATQNLTITESVKWFFNGTNWQSNIKPPICAEPIVLQMPVNISLVTSVLYPGQLRGGNYKAHGGFRFDNSANEEIIVTAPYDGYLMQGVRYLENGNVQYMFDIINSCGIMYRLDHLKTLSGKLMEAANNLSEPIEGDTRTYETLPIQIIRGEILATAVGVQGNTFVDLGVYDLRSKNEAANNSEWMIIHSNSQAPYALCWLNLFTSQDSTALKELPGADSISGKTSDYCK